jgi:RNAse (barnase) inhibitor barstar/TATA-box binding protein (TBP) (component of TFIID and TFIIIB)
MDNPDFFGDSLRNDSTVFFAEIDGSQCTDEEALFREFFNQLKLSFFSWDGFGDLERDLNNFERKGENSECSYIYIYIRYVDKILDSKMYHYSKINFFGVVYNLTNKKVFFIVDKSQKNYVLAQINDYKNFTKRLENNAIRYSQLLFVDNVKDVKIEESDFFARLNGQHCEVLHTFYNEISVQLRFPYYFGRNLDAFDECINDFEWFKSYNVYYDIFFIYIENAQKILPGNDYERMVFFGLLNEITNRRVFIIINNQDKEFVMNEIENYKKL